MPTNADHGETTNGHPLGSRVYVRLGLDELPGVVVDRYDSASGGRVVVRLDPQGPDEAESQTVTLPDIEVYSESEAAKLNPSGTWVHSTRYERDVHSALDRIVDHLRHIKIPSVIQVRDGTFDFLINLNDVWLAVEVKYLGAGEFTEERAMDILRQLKSAPTTAKIVVSNVQFPPRSHHRLIREHVVPITWRTASDDSKLEDAIEQAFAEARSRRDAGF